MLLLNVLVYSHAAHAAEVNQEDQYGIYHDSDYTQRDPFERLNRKIFAFNHTLDRIVIKPVAKGYGAATPQFIQSRIHNFFSNLLEPLNAINALLQLKPKNFSITITRFIINSFWGIGGLHDVAKEAGLRYESVGFDKTLKHYGVKTGPYIVLPIIGPSSVRGTAAFALDVASDPFNHTDSKVFLRSRTGVSTVDARVRIFPVTDLISKSSVDEYVTYRTLYFEQH